MLSAEHSSLEADLCYLHSFSLSFKLDGIQERIRNINYHRTRTDDIISIIDRFGHTVRLKIRNKLSATERFVLSNEEITTLLPSSLIS